MLHGRVLQNPATRAVYPVMFTRCWDETTFVWTGTASARDSFPSNRDNYAAYQFGILMSYARAQNSMHGMDLRPEHARMRPPLWRKLAWLIAVSLGNNSLTESTYVVPVRSTPHVIKMTSPAFELTLAKLINQNDDTSYLKWICGRAFVTCGFFLYKKKKEGDV